jgi:branched-chain amino acid transport system ATP-binding protein
LEKIEKALLKVEGLSVMYGSINALQEVNLEIRAGEVVVLLGANGAGKSTLLKAILGMLQIKKGHIFFQDQDITHKETNLIVESGICLLPEGRGILPQMLVWENLQLGGYHFNNRLIKKDMEKVFKRFPILEERSGQMAGKLSGGQQQILSIGRGLMANPKLLMLDEPSLGLSPVMVSTVFDIIKELNQEGYSILLSEQNAHKALQLANRGYVFERGQVVLSGSVEELNKDTKVHQAYLGGYIYD